MAKRHMPLNVLMFMIKLYVYYNFNYHTLLHHGKSECNLLEDYEVDSGY